MPLNPNPKPPRGFNRDRIGAAEYLGCKPATLADQARQGKGPAYIVVGGRAWYRDSDLDAYLESRMVRPVHLTGAAA